MYCSTFRGENEAEQEPNQPDGEPVADAGRHSAGSILVSPGQSQRAGLGDRPVSEEYRQTQRHRKRPQPRGRPGVHRPAGRAAGEGGHKKGDRHLFHFHLFHNSTETTPYPSLGPRNHARRPLKGANHLRNAPERHHPRHFNQRSHSNIDSSGQVKWFWRGVHTSARHNECAQNDDPQGRQVGAAARLPTRVCAEPVECPQASEGLECSVGETTCATT